MAAGFVIHHRLKDRVKDGHSGYPLTRATPLSEQRSVLFPQLLELCPNLPFTPSTAPPPVRATVGVVSTTFGTQVSPETPVWHHCLSCPQCGAARSRPSDGCPNYTVRVS